jgi:hypothetical protein
MISTPGRGYSDDPILSNTLLQKIGHQYMRPIEEKLDRKNPHLMIRSYLRSPNGVILKKKEKCHITLIRF